MTDYPIADANLQPHEIIDGKVHIYYSQRLTIDELSKIIRVIIVNERYNWIVIGLSNMENMTNKLCKDLLEQSKCKIDTMTQINMNSEDEDAEKHKVINALLKAIPRLKLQNDDDIDNFKFAQANENGVYHYTPLVIRALNGYLHMFKITLPIEPTEQ